MAKNNAGSSSGSKGPSNTGKGPSGGRVVVHDSGPRGEKGGSTTTSTGPKSPATGKKS